MGNLQGKIVQDVKHVDNNVVIQFNDGTYLEVYFRDSEDGFMNLGYDLYEGNII